MRSVMNHKFSEVPDVKVPRSKFNRSHGLKTSYDCGKLIPVLVDEVLPGDTYSVNMSAFARLSTPVYPIMDNMVLDTFFFFCPSRKLWENWHKFMGERENPADSIDYTIPTINYNNAATHSLWDYMGLPTKVAAAFNVNSLPFRAYNWIWNEWFRDENLQDQAQVDTDNGPDSIADYQVLRRCKRHDYFSSALPWTQKGDDIVLPIGDKAPIWGDSMHWDNVEDQYNLAQIRDAQGSSANLRTLRAGTNYVYGASSALGQADDELFADLSQATGGTVNQLRQAFQLQKMLERDARGGTRLIEIIKNHFGVNSSDARLQRPEYLGGGRSNVMVNPIARTDSSPGELGAMGTVGFSGHGFTKSFEEHGYIIGLCCVIADITYQEGVERMWSRETRYDFYWPSLSRIGEQSVLNKEIYIDATTIGSGASEDVWGYQERHAEYRYKPSRICGTLRSNSTTPLDAWHLGIEFGSQPTLDDTYIQEDPPVDRVIATPTEPHFIMDAYFNMICTRPMPIYGVPGWIDHF